MKNEMDVLKMDERQRNDAKINTDKHEELIREVGKLHGKMDD